VRQISQGAIVSVLSIVVVLAGCSGGVGGADYPETVDSETLAGHQDQIERQGGFESTLSLDNEITAGDRAGTTVMSSIRYQFDLSSEQRLTTIVENRGGQSSERVIYDAGDRLYARETGGDGSGQPVVDANPGDREGVLRSPFGVAAGSQIPVELDYERQGTSSLDGVEVARYTATDVEGETLRKLREPARRALYSPSDIESLDATVWVDRDGFIRKAEVTYTVNPSDGETRDVTLTYTLDSVGETQIDKPSWTQDAVPYNQTSGS